MTNPSSDPKPLERHPSFSLNELATALGFESGILPTRLELLVEEKLLMLCEGRARKGKDFKYLVGFADCNLFELRWDISTNSSNSKVRLIGSDQGSKLILLAWHVKDADTPSEVQRDLMNMACLSAIERMRSLE